jgi:hypothetical protein
MKKFTTLLVLFLFTYASTAQDLECPRFLNPDEPQPTKTIANREGVAVAPSKEMYVFNVKIHYIKNTNGTGVNYGKEQAQNAMLILNETYNKINIYFKLSGFDYIYNSDYKNIRSTNKNTNPNHPTINQLVNYSKTGTEKPIYDVNALNIFVVENINENPVTYGSATNGIGYLPGTVSFFTYNSFLSTTLLHEVGHNFNLEHTYNLSGTSKCELVSGENAATAGDFVTDTPAAPLILPSSDYSSSCSYVNSLKIKDCAGVEFRDVQIANIMGHDNPCRDLGDNFSANEIFFTPGQGFRMRDQIKNYIDSPNNMYGYNKAKTSIDKLYEPIQQIAVVSANEMEVSDDENDLGMANVCQKTDGVAYEFQKGFKYSFISEDGSKKYFNSNETPKITTKSVFNVKMINLDQDKLVQIQPVISDEYVCVKQKYVAINIATTTNLGNGSIHYKQLSSEEINSTNIFNSLPKNTFNIITKETDKGIKTSKKIYKY